MPQKKDLNRSLRPVRVIGADALGLVRGGAEDFVFTKKVDKASPTL